MGGAEFMRRQRAVSCHVYAMYFFSFMGPNNDEQLLVVACATERCLSRSRSQFQLRH